MPAKLYDAVNAQYNWITANTASIISLSDFKRPAAKPVKIGQTK